MPYSKNQQIAARIALSSRKGKFPTSKLKGASLSMNRSMSTNELQDYSRGPIVRKGASAAR